MKQSLLMFKKTLLVCRIRQFRSPQFGNHQFHLTQSLGLALIDRFTPVIQHVGVSPELVLLHVQKKAVKLAESSVPIVSLRLGDVPLRQGSSQATVFEEFDVLLEYLTNIPSLFITIFTIGTILRNCVYFILYRPLMDRINDFQFICDGW